MKQKITALILASLIFFVLAPEIHAQQVQQITITPPKISLTLSPGDKTEGRLGIINDSDTDMTFITGIYDFIVTDTSGTPEFLPSTASLSNKYSAASWIAIDPTNFTVKQHQRLDFTYYVQIPKDAAPGGHYAALMYQPVHSPNQSGSVAVIQTQIATLMLISVRGTIKEYAHVTRFQAPTFLEYGPITISTEIKNYGDLHISPQGAITIKDFFGRIIAASPLDAKNIFPGNIAREYTNTIGSRFMIGRFTATLLGNYGTSGNLPLSATISFWIFPWRIAIIILFILITIILGLLVLKKRNDTYQEELDAFDPTKNVS